MVKKSGSDLYRLWIEPEAQAMREQLPGNVRQRIKKQISEFAKQPKPAISQTLDITGLEVPDRVEIRRARLENWRIIYAVNESEKWVWVLAIRKRPPYNYEDLSELAVRLVE